MHTNNPQLSAYFDTITKYGMYSTVRNLKSYLEYFFGQYDLFEKNVLDVGGGSGLLTFYAAYSGSTVTCVEPQGDGSSDGMNERFIRVRDDLGIPEYRAQLARSTIQSFDFGSNQYDLIVMSNSINHIDEQHCIAALHNRESQLVFVEQFKRFVNHLKPGGSLIMTDCSRYNFFATIGLKNPLMPTIEWEKHLPPEVWAQLLIEAGFVNVSIEWSAPNTLGRIGRRFLGNKLSAYFLFSHFRISARTPA